MYPPLAFFCVFGSNLVCAKNSFASGGISRFKGIPKTRFKPIFSREVSSSHVCPEVSLAF